MGNFQKLTEKEKAKVVQSAVDNGTIINNQILDMLFDGDKTTCKYKTGDVIAGFAMTLKQIADLSPDFSEGDMIQAITSMMDLIESVPESDIH